MEMHLFDEDAREEMALCGVGSSADFRRSVNGYLEDRLNEADVGTVCEGCKGRTIPFAQSMTRDLEIDGLLDEAGKYHELVEILLRETTPN